MALATGAVVAGAAAAVAAYVDGKYNIREDVGTMLTARDVQRTIERQAKQNKVSIWYQFEQQVKARPADELCLWYRTSPQVPAQTYTWPETYSQTCRYSQFLLSCGVKPGQLVGTYLQNSPEFIFTLVGLWGIGSAPALINFHLSGDALVHCLKVAGCQILVVDEDAECRQRVEDVQDRLEKELGLKLVYLDAEIRAHIHSVPPTRPEDTYRRDIRPTSPIFIFYTSGTTGMPKACPLRTAAAYSFAKPRLMTTGMVPGDRWYDCMPLYHGTGGTTAVTCLTAGVGLCIGRKFSVRNFWHDVHDSESNAFVYVGETARYLLAAPPSKLDTTHKLKAMYGNGMRPDIWVRFQERFAIPCINEFFNSTEGVFVLLNVARNSYRAGSVGFHGGLMRRQMKDVYVPVEIDYQTGDGILRDPKTGFAHRKSFEEGGEIIVKMADESGFSGYWRNPEATAKKFERNVFEKGDLYYRTGDALRRDKDGRWYFVDRLGDTFRWKSENVSTAQVAEVLGSFPNIVEANVYGVEVPSHDGRAGCAAIFIPPEQRSSFDWSGLLAHARKELPSYAVPIFLRVIENPTPMHNNKQNKAPLKKEGIELRKIKEGTAGPSDSLMWVKGKANATYEVFDQAAYDELVAGKAKL